MSTSKPQKVQLLPFQQQNISSNQQQVPLPYLGGERLIAAIWMTSALNKITQKASGGGKKG